MTPPAADDAQAGLTQELADIEDNIRLHVSLLQSLDDVDSDGDDDDDSSYVIQKTLRRLRKRKDEIIALRMQDQDSMADPYSPLDDEPDARPRSEHSDAVSRDKKHLLMAPPTRNLVSRKRTRGDLDDEDTNQPLNKSMRPTPSPIGSAAPSPVASSLGSFDFDDLDDPVMGKLLGGKDWLSEVRADRAYLRELEREQAGRKRQEEEDFALAQSLQEQWDKANAAPSKPVAPSNYIQAKFKPTGGSLRTLAPPSPPPKRTGNSKLEPFSKFEQASSSSRPFSGWSTPPSDDDSLEEISAHQFTTHVRRSGAPGQRQYPPGKWIAPPRGSNSMPGAFPVTTPYASAGGAPVYNSGFSTLDDYDQLFSELASGLVTLPPVLGSSKLPFSLNDLDGYADPAKTQEELRDLLKHIRPDEEITASAEDITPAGLDVTLMAHQVKGLAWMKSMEEGTNKGGVLADDMGLGKTVQALALMLARPPPENAHKPTLVVAPVALMRQWEREINKMVRGSHKFDVAVLHGVRTRWANIRDKDVILITYGMLSAELKRKIAWDEKVKRVPGAQPTLQEECPILGDRSKFWRVILDEAQSIKNKSTKGAIAACQVQAVYRWCLSGTPMQNSVEEMYSLIKFCRIRPYCEWDKFSREIARPLKNKYEPGKQKAMQQLQVLLKAVLLRRTKSSKIDGKPILQLPPKTVTEVQAFFSEDELNFYKALEGKTQLQYNRYLKAGTVGRNYSNILVLLLRLRQACCHPHLLKDFAINTGGAAGLNLVENAKEFPKDVVERLKQAEACECPICFDVVENPIIFFPCGHNLCEDCLAKLVDGSLQGAEGEAVKCPHCRAKIDTNKVTDMVSFLRVFCPERPGVTPLEDSDQETASETDSDDQVEDESDDGEDLRDFVVPDDDVEHDSDASDSKPNRRSKVASRATEGPSKSKSKKPRKSRKSKGKETGRKKTQTLAELRREGLRNKSAKRKYLKRLEKTWVTSAKIERTLELLSEIRDNGEGEKTIIFSGFTSFLDLLEVPLAKHNDFDSYARYDGSMTSTERNDAVITFTDNPRCKIMLVSLKAGNAGLNLTVANHVIILGKPVNPEYTPATNR